MTPRLVPVLALAISLPAFPRSPGRAAEEERTIPLGNAQSRHEAAHCSPLENGGFSVVVAGGSSGYPGVGIRPESGEVWDLSEHGRVEAVVRNDGEVALPVSLRVDNPGHWRDEPWNTESTRLAPGETGTVVVFFGYGNGFGESFDLDPSRVRQLLFFTRGAARGAPLRGGVGGGDGRTGRNAGLAAGERPPRSGSTVPCSGRIVP